MNRIIALVDMDCFYVQVEQRDNPHIIGVPAAVVQYNTWQGGGIIAVNYEARAEGVTRRMRGDQAKAQCPQIQLVQVPVLRGKANLTKYRDAGKEVINVLCKFSDVVERASIDEAYIDLTDIVNHRMKQLRRVDPSDLYSTWIVGFDEGEDQEKEVVRSKGLLEWINETVEEDSSDGIRLSVAALICEEMRKAVFDETGFRCSAGISHCKMLSKLACGIHKPNQQTVLPFPQVPVLWEKMPLQKVRNLGGKLGNSLVEDFGCETMADLAKLTSNQLKSKYDEKTAGWLIDLGRGIDNEKVTARQLPKSIGCGKNFTNRDILNTKEKVQHWMGQLAEELSERLIEDQNDNKRRAKTITVSISQNDGKYTSMSRSCPLPSHHQNEITKIAYNMIKNSNKADNKDPAWKPPIVNISLSAGKFNDMLSQGSSSIEDMFKKAAAKKPTPKKDDTSVCDTSVVEDSQVKKKLFEDTTVPKYVTPNGKKDKRRTFQFEKFFQKKDADQSVLENSSLNATKKIVINDKENNNTENITESEKATVIQPDTNSNSNSNSFFKNYMLKKAMENNCKNDPNTSESKSKILINLNEEPIEDAELSETDVPKAICNEQSTSKDDNSHLDCILSCFSGESEDDDDADSDHSVSMLSPPIGRKFRETQHQNSSPIQYSVSPRILPGVSPEPECFDSCTSNDRLKDSNTKIEDSFDSLHDSGSGLLGSDNRCLDKSKKDFKSLLESVGTDNESSDSEIISKPEKYNLKAKFIEKTDINESSNNISEVNNEEKYFGINYDTNPEFIKAKETLEGIFPDLNDIDPNTMECLPENLQNAHKIIIKMNKIDTEIRTSFEGILQNVTSEETRDENTTNDRIQSDCNSTTDNSEGYANKQVDSSVSHQEMNLGENRSNLDLSDLVPCEECGKMISAFEMVEHLDYHMAVKIRNEQISISSPNINNQIKRKRKSPKIAKDISKLQKLDSFFKTK